MTITNRSTTTPQTFSATYGQARSNLYALMYGHRLTQAELVKCVHDYVNHLPIDQLDKVTGILEVILSAMVANTAGLHGEKVDKTDFLTEQAWFHELVHSASTAGFTKLGQGFFSAAFTHRLLAGKVIKVGFKKEDSGAAYAAFCRANQGKDGIPEVYSIQRHSACYMVVMKHYKEIVKYAPLSGGLTEQGTLAHFVASLIEREDAEERWGERSEMTKLLHEYPDLHRTCKEIRAFFKGVAVFDCHAGNMMWDEQKSCIVITDPVSYSRQARITAPKDFMMSLHEAVKPVDRGIAANLMHRVDAGHQVLMIKPRQFGRPLITEGLANELGAFKHY